MIVDPSSLSELVLKFRVCWEVWPEYAFVGWERLQIGFALELSGTHEQGLEHPIPACPHCGPVYDGLRTIADSILPREQDAVTYDVSSYDQALHYSRRRHKRPDVSLTIRILHREDVDRPVDALQTGCLEQMKQRLKELGSPEGQWSR